MARPPKRRVVSRRKRGTNAMILNVAVLLLCLVVILVFKQIVAQKTAEFIDEFSPAEGSGTETNPDAIALSINVARELLDEAREAGLRRTRNIP